MKENIKIEMKIEKDMDSKVLGYIKDPILQTFLDESLFCILCYTTFSSKKDRSPHQQKIHNTPEDQAALKRNVTKITLQDLAHVCDIWFLKIPDKEQHEPPYVC